jgi:hypothetical protein
MPFASTHGQYKPFLYFCILKLSLKYSIVMQISNKIINEINRWKGKLMVNNLTQSEADTLLKLEKHYRENNQLVFPTYGGKLSIPLFSDDNREEFIINVQRSEIKLTKNTLLTRTRKTIVLARIDIDGPPHRNPDGEEIPCPHFHLYRAGYNDKWAEPLPGFFKNPTDTFETLNDFMDFCVVITKPIILRELFS